MLESVIGADGFVGNRLQVKYSIPGTSRRNPTLHQQSYLDLLDFEDGELPRADVVYLCAGVNGANACEGNRDAHRVNVDATIRICQHYAKYDGFVVWISSSTVEWSNSAYARQKGLAEATIRLMPNVGIVRAGRVLTNNVDELCDLMVRIGRNRQAGLVNWGSEAMYKR